jgi:hypothetical protein
MTDSYLGFANSTLGSRIAAMLGLPQPLPLERFKPGQPVIKGGVLLGGGGTPQLLERIGCCLQGHGRANRGPQEPAAMDGTCQRSRHDDRPLGRGRPAG